MHNPVGYRIRPPVVTLNIHPIANAMSVWDANDIIYVVLLGELSPESINKKIRNGKEIEIVD